MRKIDSQEMGLSVGSSFFSPTDRNNPTDGKILKDKEQIPNLSPN
jgi:hypothetical protein